MRAAVVALMAAAAVTVMVSGTAAQAPVAASAAGANLTKIGYVDFQRVLARSAAGVAAREQLEREKANIQKELQGKGQEIEKLRDELEKKGPLMTVEVRREKQEQFERKRREAARLQDDLLKDLEKKESVLTSKVLAEIVGVVEKVGKAQNYRMIVERRSGGVIWGAGEADVTDEVIRTYDQEAGSKKK